MGKLVSEAKYSEAKYIVTRMLALYFGVCLLVGVLIGLTYGLTLLLGLWVVLAVPFVVGPVAIGGVFVLMGIMERLDA